MTMSRRDTIILAVLINASLLSILFFTATRPDSHSPIDNPAKTAESTSVSLPSLNPNSGFAAARTEKIESLDPTPKPFQIAFDERPTTVVEVSRQQEAIHSPAILSQTARETGGDEEQHEPYAEVMVKRGDFLEKIARTNGTTVGEIRRINNLTSDRIDIGQVLLVPATKKVATPATPVPIRSNAIADSAEFYVIRPGDNPWNIARAHHIKVDELLRLNNLDEDKARNLKPGDKIRVR